MRYANLVVRFLLELCALGALGYWGFRTGEGLVVDVLLGVGAPLVMVLLWGAFVAPKARRRLADPARLLLEVALFTLAVAALAAAGATVLALVLAGVLTLNLSLMVAWRQRGVA
jgi:hypothetical protein